MAKNEHSSEQTQICLLKITEIAAAIRELAEDILQPDRSHEVNKAIAVRELASQIGWISGIAADVLAGEPVQEETAQWMLPLGFFSAQGDSKVNHA